MTSEKPPPPGAAPQPDPHQAALTLIGIGASAGGLRALQGFFAALPADTGMTFVVVVHLPAEHESLLAELLQPRTTMPVQQVTMRVAMQPNHVYIIPPGKRLLVDDAHLNLAEFEVRQGQRLQIDLFFRSLAEQHSDGAAVILSGLGSDGAAGIQAIKGRGGLVLVQSPEEAEYDNMPRSAIATGLVDVVAPVAELAAQLVAAKQTKAQFQLPQEVTELPESAQQTFTQILAQLRVRSGHDFSGYKRSTLLRRIMRRMQLLQHATLTSYLHYLRQSDSEGTILFRDLLITVTEFFRDPEAWDKLAQLVIPALFAGKGRDDQVRVWSVGCATGEEAYTLTILLLEYAATLANPPAIQVFASDLSEDALAFARQGLYPEAIAANVAEERLTHFFSQENSHYHIRKEAREHILFTHHNVLQDPPFSRLDLISCRNLLIYLGRELQEKISETFYYALRPEGYLFLGSAETADAMPDLFTLLEKQTRLYRRTVQRSSRLVLPALPLLPRDRPQASRAGPERPKLEDNAKAHQQLLEELGPPSLLVDEAYTVCHLSEQAGRYLLTPGGLPTTEVLQLVRPELQGNLRLALYQAFTEQKSTLTPPVPVRFNGAPQRVMLLVRPSPRLGYALVTFLEDETPQLPAAEAGHAAANGDAARRQLAAELRQTQERLQTMHEEFESTVEELRAANEELQSTNEEYRSTLEELETSKEELQSINEELHTINQELKHKVDEVSQAHSDLQNLLTATEIATLFLDRSLRIKRYTPRAALLFNLVPTDRDRPITHLRSNLEYPEFEADAQGVLANLVPVEREVRSAEGRWFLGSIRPYRTVEDRIAGVVSTFIEITARRQAEEAVARALKATQLLRDLSMRIIVSGDLHVLYEEILTGALVLAQAEAGTVQRFEQETHTLVLLAAQGFDRHMTEYFQRVDVQSNTSCGLALKTGERTFVDFDSPDQNDPDGSLQRHLAAGYLSAQSTPLITRSGRVIGMVSTHWRTHHRPDARVLRFLDLLARQAADLIERKEAEESLRVAHAQTQEILESISDMFYAVDAQWRLTYVNHRVEQMWNRSRETLLGTVLWEMFPGYETSLGYQMHEQAMRERKSLTWETFSPYLNIWVEVHAYPSGTGLAVYFQNVSERKQAEAALQASEAKYHTLFTAMDAGFCIIEVLFDEQQHPVDYRFLEVNPAFAQQTGLHDAAGKRMRALAPLHEGYWYEIYGQVALTGEPTRFENHAAQLQRWFDVSAFRIGEPQAHWVAVLFTDITARKQAEAALQQLNQNLEQRVTERTQALELSNRELDQFAHVAAHDLKEPLRAIAHLASFVQADNQGHLPPASQAHLTKVQERTQYMSKLLDDLYVYAQAGRQRHPFERIEVAALVQKVAALLDPPAGFTVTIVEPMPTIVSERVPLETVLRNLLGNAFKHHPNPAVGQVTITAQLQNNWLAFAVSDNGAGMARPLQQQIFESAPAFPPHTQNAQRGIGLILVRKLVESRGGSIQVTSTVGAGAAFRFTWPTAAALAAADSAHAADSA